MKFSNYAKIFLVFVLTVFSFGGGFAQDFRYPVVARITQKAPYPIYLNEYANPAQQNFAIQLEVRDNLLPTRQVKLRLFIEGSGINVQSVPTVRNEQVITLAAGQTYDLPANLVANYFKNYNLTLSPARYATSLPEGSYRFGIQVIDAITNQGLSGVQYAAPVWITVNEPPVWILPQNAVLIAPQEPQNINFQWAARHKNVTDVEYEFSLVELQVPINYNGNIQNFFLSQPPIYTERTRNTNINYSFAMPPLLPGKIYAYRVKAMAKAGLEDIGLFRNGGLGEIQWFRYTNPLNPPYNVGVERFAADKLRMNWDGYPNHKQFILNYRQKGENAWNETPVSREQSLITVNSFGEDFGNFDPGNYEIRVGASGNFYFETAYSDIVSLKDTLQTPYNLRSEWRDSTTAFVRWMGNQAHRTFRLEYKTSIERSWRQITYATADDVSLSDEAFEFGTFVDGVVWDSNYVFRITAIDFEREERTSRESYLVKKAVQEKLFKLKEKTILGKISWALFQSEEEVGAISGQAVFADVNVLRKIWRSPTFNRNKRNNKESELIGTPGKVGFDTHPLAKATVGIFADSACTVLIKSIQANAYGLFKLRFPIEALRGGSIPALVYLKFDNPAFGRFVRQVRTDFNADEYTMGDWVIPANSFRLRPLIDNGSSFGIRPEDHTFTLYRRVVDVQAAPYLLDEHMGRANPTAVKINNEDYYEVGVVNSGQVASGLFSTVNKKKQEILLKYEGPVPFQEYFFKEVFDPKGGIWQHNVVIKPQSANPYVYGNITAKNGGTLNANDISVKFFKGNKLLTFGFPDNQLNYRINIPLNSYESDAIYYLKVYYQNKLTQEIPISLNAKVLGTEYNIQLKANQLTAVLLRIKEEDNKGLSGVTVKVGAKSYQTETGGWMTFPVPEGTSTRIQILRTGYPAVTKTIAVAATASTEYTPGNMVYGSDMGLKFAIADDLVAVTDQIQPLNAEATLTSNLKSKLINSLYNQLFDLQSVTSLSVYGGTMGAEAVFDATPNRFNLNIIVRDKITKKRIENVEIRGESLEVLGKTTSSGQFYYRTHIGRGQKSFEVIPAAGSKNAQGNDYGDARFTFNFPKLNSSSTSQSVIVELEGGAVISGIVYKSGTTTRIPYARVTIEFPGLDTYVTADAAGRYAYRFNPTEKENFVTLTTTKNGYVKRAVYIATAKSYGTLYERDIYLRSGGTDDLEPEVFGDTTVNMNILLYGYEVTKISRIVSGGKRYSLKELKYNVAIQPQPWSWTIDGEFVDRQGRKFEFYGAFLTLKAEKKGGSKEYDIQLGEVLSRAIPLVTANQNKKFMDAIQIKRDELLYLGPLYHNVSAAENRNRGVVYFNSLKLAAGESDEITYIVGEATTTGRITTTYDDSMPDYQSYSYMDTRYGKRQFVISASETDEPVKEISMYPQYTHKRGIFTELQKYYAGNTESVALITQYRNNASPSFTGMFYYNNVLFSSLSISNKGPQINNVIVIPLMSISNIKMDLMNIDFVRLSENQIKDILIDYSYSPRTLSMGDDVVNAQIEEVYVEADGVDVVYFTNDKLNVIDIDSPDMTPINYNANGIFYSDYQNQKEIVQTAAILNEVQMYQIPEPAMGPGTRMKVSALQDLAGGGTGFHHNPLENSPKYAFNGDIPEFMIANPADKTASLKLEGTGDITMDPHVLKTSWKYDDKTKKWAVKLSSFSSTYGVWGELLRPVSMTVVIANPDDASLVEEAVVNEDKTVTKVDFAALKGAELQVNYGVAIPALGSFDLVCEAKFDPAKGKFVRSTVGGKVEITVPKVFEAKITASILIDSEEIVSGVFVAGEVTITPLGVSGSLAGGYACIERASDRSKCDMIWGFQAGLGREDGIGPKSFKLYGAKAGYLYDAATSSSFLLASASVGIGKPSNFDKELMQLMPDSKGDSTAKKQRKDKKVQAVEDLETAGGDLNARNTTKTATEGVVNTKSNELEAAKTTKLAKKTIRDEKKAVQKTNDREFEKKEKEKEDAAKKLTKLEQDGDLATRTQRKDAADDDLTNATTALNDSRNDKDAKLTARTNLREQSEEEGVKEYNKKQEMEAARKAFFDDKGGTDSVSVRRKQDLRDKYEEVNEEYSDQQAIAKDAENARNTANDAFDEAEDKVKVAKSDSASKKNALTKVEAGIQEFQDAEADLSTKESDFTTAETNKTAADDTFNEADTEYTAASSSVSTAKDDLSAAKSDLKDAEKAVRKFNRGVKDSTSASAASLKADDRRAKVDSIDSALKKKYKSTDSTKYKGVKKFVLEELFVISTGRSPFDAKAHKFTVDNAELTFSTGKTGTTITGAGEFGSQGQPLFTAAFMIYAGKPRAEASKQGFRMFFAMPSFTRSKVGAITDMTINAQLEFGNDFYKNAGSTTVTERADIMLMGSFEGTVQLHAVVYANINARLAFALNASTDQKLLTDRLAAGANLSETARKIVKLFGSSFNTIAEEAIGQRMAFFGALPPEYIVDNTFSGFYVGAKASVLLGRTQDVSTAFFSGSARAGIGVELGLGILKSIGNSSWQFRMSVNPIVELSVRIRAPIEAVIIDEKIDYLSKFCMATGYNSLTESHYIKILYNIIKTDQILGEVVIPGNEIACNSFGFFYVKPCVFIYVRYDSTKKGDSTVNGIFVDTKLEEDPTTEICPIEW